MKSKRSKYQNPNHKPIFHSSFPNSSQGFTQPHFLGIKDDLMKTTDDIICLKQASKRLKSGAGFTLIELLVVLAIMGILTGFMAVNIAGTRGVRNLKIAQSQLVTNLRKIQSYTLSSRNISPNIPAQFYLIKFDRGNPGQYTIQAIYDVTVSPKLIDIETIKFPEGINFVVTDPVEIDRQPTGSSGANDQRPTNCALVAFKAPFAKIIMNDGCSFANFINDDYAKIKDFVTNDNMITASTDSIMTIKLYEQQKGTIKTVTVNGINGLISFGQ